MLWPWTPCGHSEGREHVFLSVLEISELGVSWMLSKSAFHCGPWAAEAQSRD